MFRTTKVTIKPNCRLVDYRYKFDLILSRWLNRANKQKAISDFFINDTTVTFLIHPDLIEHLKAVLTEDFAVTYE
jgi:hypothetical protein